MSGSFCVPILTSLTPSIPRIGWARLGHATVITNPSVSVAPSSKGLFLAQAAGPPQNPGCGAASLGDTADSAAKGPEKDGEPRAFIGRPKSHDHSCTHPAEEASSSPQGGAG